MPILGMNLLNMPKRSKHVGSEDDPASPLARVDDLTDDRYPNCYNISAGLVGWRFLPIPSNPSATTEYFHVPINSPQGIWDKKSSELFTFATRWNSAWESSHLRAQMFADDEIPAGLTWLEKYDDVDIRIIPGGRQTPYIAYESLYHLLTLETLHYSGLPPLQKGYWPSFGAPWHHRIQNILPSDYATRLKDAFSAQLWPHFSIGRKAAFSGDESLVVLSHALDFWLPYVDKVAQARLSRFDRVANDADDQEVLSELPEDLRATVHRPRKGGDIWYGKSEAEQAMQEMVELADGQGRLREIIHTIRCNRVEDDFSSRWSYAKEDFERKIFHKRNKVRVKFVELDDTIPVHGPQSEVEGNLVWQDLMTVCNRKEREVVVCLRRGVTKATDIADELGYTNHSAVSKRLKCIRSKVARMFDLDGRKG